VYRPDDGRVVQVNNVVVFEGGKTITREEAEKEAIENARLIGHDVKGLKLLFVDELPSSPSGLRVEVVNGVSKLTVLKRPLRYQIDQKNAFNKTDQKQMSP
jgi:hypothetical protein